MLNYEFWSLLSLTLVFHGLMAAVAVLIYFKQQAFQRQALGKIDAAVVGIEKDLHDPLVMQALCKTMLDDLEVRIATKIRLSMQGMFGNAQQQLMKIGGASASSKAAAFFHVMSSKNKLKAAKDVAPMFFGDENDDKSGTTASGLVDSSELGSPGSPPKIGRTPEMDNSARIQEMNAFMQAQLTPAQIEAGNKKAKELGLA